MTRWTIIIGFILTGTAILPAQDSIVAENIFRHEIRNGSRTALKHLIEQNTYNKAGQKVLQIYYYDSVPNIKTYTLFFYENDWIKSKETFTSDKAVISVERFSYDEKGNPKEARFYKPLNNSMQNSSTTVFSYSDTMLVKKVILGSSGKWVEQHSYEYKPGQLTETTLYRKGSQAENLKSAKITSAIPSGKIVTRTIENISYNKARQQFHVEYLYNNTTGKLTDEKWYDAQNQLIKSYQYRWDIDGTLRDRATLDPSGNYIDFITYRYKNYVVNLGDQQMLQFEESISK
jgi:hypothetical protein